MTERIVRWRVSELSLPGSAPRSNPYLADVDVTFAGPVGTTIRRPAFWDGHSWKVRFAATLVGPWRYTVRASDDEVLDGASGSMLAEEAPAGGGPMTRGFLRRSPTGRHLEHGDGTPFFWLGDTHWRFTAETWQGSVRDGWDSWFRGVVDRRVEQGFTVYQANLMLFDWGAADSRYFLPGRLFREPDLDYFHDVVDPRMAYLAERGLVVALGLAWHQSIDGNVDGVRRFAREIVARYGAQPMVWTLGGEVAGYEPELREQRIDGWREVARAIQAADGYHHPLTAHATNERPIAPYYPGEDWFTFALNQHGHGDRDLSTAHYRDFFARHPNVPLVEGESLYEGLTSVEYVGRRPVTDVMVRHVAYRAIQSGCCGYTYGAQGCWNAGETGEDIAGWGSSPWYVGVDLPGSDQMGHLRRFYEELPWHELMPDADGFHSSSATNDAFYRPEVTAVADRSVVVIYFGETYRLGEGRARLSALLDEDYVMTWFDPRTGLRRRCGTARPTAGRLDVPDKPSAGDWLLVVRTTARIQESQDGTGADRADGSTGIASAGEVARR